ncbi:hypothetical protein ISR11_1675 [Streptococcus pyogenes]|nr:hypothetical protein A20_1560c [Streptococcus pyogenes A20]EPZ42045.1 hypothetical protein HMPREF1228_0181 [Streptococcus pyogenes GA41345]EQL79016.1 hypothetical protein HMPREF1226_1368 [Streptococcus pyogenes UTMEM-1]EQL79761.1 hypothetical protein HMPREF1225_0110 [Streptococcus pyogenes UTSW-2]ERL17905.1 hypothetical protein HMPREF1227_1314 [Streptococcus pyogenes GA41046]ESA46025.1 hypothetical protein HMPREF1232_1446 [Streptococcus pyogenes GA40468]ESA53366.1 hypothetical protein HMPR
MLSLLTITKRAYQTIDSVTKSLVTVIIALCGFTVCMG